MITYFFLIVSAYTFLGSLIFSLTTGASSAPKHRISRTYGAITRLDLNYIHLSFSVADVFNKVGVTAVAFLAGNRLLNEHDERVNERPNGRLDEKKVLASYSAK